MALPLMSIRIYYTEYTKVIRRIIITFTSFSISSLVTPYVDLEITLRA
jgi:hypothetical protein